VYNKKISHTETQRYKEKMTENKIGKDEKWYK